MLRKAWTLISMVFLLFVMTLKYGEATFSSRLRNMAVIVGSKMNISCISNSRGKVHWYHVKDIVTLDPKKINQGDNIVSPDFSNFVMNGELQGQTLETNSTHPENAGLLQCKGAGYEYEAQLTVLDSDPTCNLVIASKDTPTRAELNCSVGYRGFWSPTMEWIRVKDRTKMNGHLNITANRVTLTMQISTNNSNVNTQYSCRTFFSNETRPSSGALNIPDYNSLCILTNNMGSTSDADGGTSNRKSGYTIWIITGFAGVACVVVFAVIIVFLRRNPEVCRKSSGPDLVQQADIVLNEINLNMENGVAHQPAVVADAEPEQPEDILHQNRVYAEVVVLDREFPPYMHDSPAWPGNSGISYDYRGRGIQASPAFCQPSRTGTPKNITPRTGTPRNGSPIVGMENIQYLDINSVASIPVPPMSMPRRPPARLPTLNNFQPAKYASIDHTSRPPPPPPPSDD